MRTDRKNFALEGLRGIASLTVVIGHFTFVFFPYLGTIFRPVPGAAPSFWFETLASYPPFTLVFSADAAVCIFFVLSGYVLTSRFFRSGLPQDLQLAAAKRYVRLVLPTAASILFAWLLWHQGAIISGEGSEIGVAGWVPSWYQKQFSFVGAILNGFVGAPMFAQTSLNPPTWTIQVELIGSILLFSMMALFTGRPILFIGWSAFFINLLGFRLPNDLFYVAFFAGSYLNIVREWLRSRQSFSGMLFVFGLVGVAYNLSPAFGFMRIVPLPNFQPLGPDFGVMPQLFWNAIGSIALVAGVIGSVRIDRFLASKAFVYLGRVSFSMYLIHMPILMSIALFVVKVGKNQGLSYGAATCISFVIYLCTVISLSEFFYRLIDAPSTTLATYLASRSAVAEPGRNLSLEIQSIDARSKERPI